MPDIRVLVTAPNGLYKGMTTFVSETLPDSVGRAPADLLEYTQNILSGLVAQELNKRLLVLTYEEEDVIVQFLLLKGHEAALLVSVPSPRSSQELTYPPLDEDFTTALEGSLQSALGSPTIRAFFRAWGGN